MQKLFTTIVIVSLMLITPTFAAETNVIPEVSDVDVSASPASGSVTPSTITENEPKVEDAPSVLNAAPVAQVLPSVGSSLGEYKSVACNTNQAFAVNSCDQCFVGGAVRVGDSLTGLFDNWTNPSDKMLVAYKDEQKTPNMVSFGNTTWIATPTDPSKFWKNSSDITWVPTGGTGSRLNYILQGGQKVKFVEAELGARYTLEKTDKKDKEMIGLIRFPVVSHAVDSTTGMEGAATTHYECVSYTLDAGAPAPQDPTPPTTPTPPSPSEVTKTATGPAETLILIVAAFFIAFGMMFSLRKRS